MFRRKKKAYVIKTVGYGTFSGKPNRRKIEKTINKMATNGYRLHSRDDHDVGCLASAFTLFLEHGKTELTFYLIDDHRKDAS